MSKVKKIDAEHVGRLPTFCHATVAGDFVFVSGTLGTKPDTFELVEGGIETETRQTLENLRTILAAAGASFDDVVKMSVFVSNMDDFPGMNRVYLEFFGGTPPARITVGCAGLALGARVEMDCVAYRPSRR